MKRPSWFATGALAMLAVSALAVPAAAEECGDLLIVLDRSGSMSQCKIGGKAKEQIAKDAITEIITTYSTIPMGLEVFPNTLMASGAGCAQGLIVVDIAADGGKKIIDFLKTMPTSRGGTPTAVSMEVARDYPADRWTPGRAHFVLLLTDGQPTCQDGDNPGDGGAPTMCDGKGCQECNNPFKVYDAITALKTKGIKTFVVGFGGMGEGCTSMCNPSGIPFNPDSLDKMADAGGVPNDTPGAMTKFYSATDATSLRDALRKIVGKIAGGTIGGCTKGGTGGTGGGSGAGGSGAGGSGAGGAAGGQGGAGNQGGGPGEGGSRGGGSPGCLCGVGAASAAAGLPLGAGFALGAAIALRHRRRR